MRYLAVFIVFMLYILHQDFWFWRTARRSSSAFYRSASSIT